jgi:hypothetical protein
MSTATPRDPSDSLADGPAEGLAPAGRQDAVQGVVYFERLVPSAAGWFGVVAFAAVLAVALTVAGPTVAVVTGVVALVVGCAIAWWTSPVVEVRDGILSAGGTSIPTALLGEVVTLDRDGVREQMGTGWDARAFACLRTWTGGAVRMTVLDPEDPTPYWVVSTRRPDDVAAAVASWS